MEYSYDDLIEKLNNGEIKGFKFCIKDYGHYKNCELKRTDFVDPSHESYFIIEFIRTADMSEYTRFYGKFKDNEKWFNLGKIGNFTLQQVWKRVEIKEVY